MSTTRSGMTQEAIEQLIRQRMAGALAERGVTPVARAYTYKDFLNCQPHNFRGTEGVIGLTRSFMKMEPVFQISNYAIDSQVKFSTCTLVDGALTWWNSHVQTIGIDEAYGMP
ncbi:hypothetical protein Tco_1538184 [Tanacetum coccineum]